MGRQLPTPGLTISPSSGPAAYIVSGLTSNHPGVSPGVLFYVIGSAETGYQCLETFKQGPPDPTLNANTLQELATILSERYKYAVNNDPKNLVLLPVTIVSK